MNIVDFATSRRRCLDLTTLLENHSEQEASSMLSKFVHALSMVATDEQWENALLSAAILTESRKKTTTLLSPGGRA